MATRERGVFRNKTNTDDKGARVDISSLLSVTADDISNEINAVKKNKTRIEKNNERLEEEEKKLIAQEDKWQSEITELDALSRETISKLEEKINKIRFDWTRDRAAEDRELERLNLKLETVENEMEEKQDKREQKQKQEISALKDELSALENSGAEQVTNLGRLETLVAQLRDEKKKATDEASEFKREFEQSSKSLDLIIKEKAEYESQITTATTKDEASRNDLQQKNELEESLAALKKELKTLTKESDRDKQEATEMTEVRNQLETWKKKAADMEQEITDLKSKLEKEKAEAGAKLTSAPSDNSNTTMADLGLGADAEEKKSEAERQIEELEIELKRSEYEWTEKKVELEEQLADLKKEEERLRASIDRLQEDSKLLEKELTTGRDNFQKDEREKKEDFRVVQTENTTLDREIDKTQKDLDRIMSRDVANAKRSLQEKTFELLQTNQALEASEYVYAFFCKSEERLEREQKDITEKIRLTKIELKETEDRLRQTRDELAELNETMREYIAKNNATIEKLAEECFKEMGLTDALIKQRESLRAEIARLRNYMKKDLVVEKIQDDQYEEKIYVPALAKLVEERMKELNALNKTLRATKLSDTRTLQQLAEDWTKLVKDKATYWEETSAFYVRFITVLKQLPVYSKLEAFQMPLYLLENEVHPGVLSEMCYLLELQRDGKTSAAPQTVGFLIKQAFRDIKSGEISEESATEHHHSKYSEALLQRLAVLRSTMSCRKVKSTGDFKNRIYEYCVMAILETGEEDWPEEEYQQFVSQEEKINEGLVRQRQEEQRKYAEEKAYWAKKREEKTKAASK